MEQSAGNNVFNVPGNYIQGNYNCQWITIFQGNYVQEFSGCLDMTFSCEQKQNSNWFDVKATKIQRIQLGNIKKLKSPGSVHFPPET